MKPSEGKLALYVVDINSTGPAIHSYKSVNDIEEAETVIAELFIQFTKSARDTTKYFVMDSDGNIVAQWSARFEPVIERMDDPNTG